MKGAGLGGGSALGLMGLLWIVAGLGACSESDPNPSGAGGAGAAAGTGGSAGTATGGTGGSGATGGTGATGGSGGAGDGDGYVSDVNVSVHSNVNTVLVVTWNQTLPADRSYLEFSFEDGSVMTSRAKPGSVGAHEDVVLGVPGQTLVTLRIVNEVAGDALKTRDYQGTTGAIPEDFPLPEILAYDPNLSTKERWLFGGVEDSAGGATGTNNYYRFTFWTYIMDRKGRIVWYYADPASNATSSFQRLARDGEYIWVEKRAYRGSGSARSVLKMTLDWKYFEDVPVQIADCIDVTDDGSLLYDSGNQLMEMTKDGQTRSIWNCGDHFGDGFSCYTNTINWSPADDSVLMSFPSERTVIQIDRQTGEVVGQYGEAAGSYAFSPDTWGFGYQHFPNITADGTLIVSSHMPGYENTNNPVAGQHAFMEFTIDRANQTLIEKWIYHEGPEWATYKGMAVRLPNGNTLANYGTGGVIREITPDMQTVFHVKFDVPTGDDFYNKMVGNNFFIDDLYAMNGGPN